jgi:hypothetical protein
MIFHSDVKECDPGHKHCELLPIHEKERNIKIETLFLLRLMKACQLQVSLMYKTG